MEVRVFNPSQDPLGGPRDYRLLNGPTLCQELETLGIICFVLVLILLSEFHCGPRRLLRRKQHQARKATSGVGPRGLDGYSPSSPPLVLLACTLHRWNKLRTFCFFCCRHDVRHPWWHVTAV